MTPIPVIALYLNDPSKDDLYEEFIALIESAGKTIVEEFVQDRYPTSSHYFGRGFLDRINNDFENELSDKLSVVQQAIISSKLTPLQYYNITQLLPIEIIDKFELVLEIFSQRTNSQEAKLQIELARLQYQHVHERTRLSGKMVGRFGTERRGFGATGQLKYGEIIANFRAKESTIKQKLEKIKKDRSVQRRNRTRQAKSDKILRIALTGYTNAGKSSLLNALTKANVEVKDLLFTTLGTTTRSFNYQDLPIMITDTVGFIQDLPATLIDAFRSTLEESLETEFVAIVVDISEELDEIKRKIPITLDLIKDMGVSEKQIWLIFNKIDQRSSEDQLWISDWIEKQFPDYPYCLISAKENQIDEFLKLIGKNKKLKQYIVVLPATMQQMRSKFYSNCNIIQENYDFSKNPELIHLNVQTRRPSLFLKLVSEAKEIDENVSYIEIT